MRRSFVLAMTVLLLVFTLTACGSRSNNTANPPSTPQNETTAPGNVPDSTVPNQNTTANDMVNDVVNDVENAVDDVLPDNNATTRQRSIGGVPYGDMMHNDRK